MVAEGQLEASDIGSTNSSLWVSSGEAQNHLNDGKKGGFLMPGIKTC